MSFRDAARAVQTALSDASSLPWARRSSGQAEFRRSSSSGASVTFVAAEPVLSHSASASCAQGSLGQQGDPGGSSGEQGDPGGPPSSIFRSLLRQLEAEHAREVTELQEEICRLGGSAGQDQEERPEAGGPAEPSAPEGEGDAGACRFEPEQPPPRQVDDVKNEVCSYPPLSRPLSAGSLLSIAIPQFQPVLPCEARADSSAAGGPPSCGNSELDENQEQLLLRVKIIGATGIQGSDWRKGKLAEPYCTCSVDGNSDLEFRTYAVQTPADPVWNYEAVIDEYTSGSSISFVVHDHGWLETDHALASATLESSAFCEQGFFEGMLPLHTQHHDSRAFLRLVVELAPMRHSEAFKMRNAWMRTGKDSSRTVAPAEKRALKTGWLNSEAEDMPHGEGQAKRTRRWVGRLMLDPSSSFRLTWNVFGILLVSWDMVWLPMQVFQPPQTTGLLVLGWIVLLYWTCDILVTFNTGLLKRGGVLVMDRKQVAWYYLCRWFVPDVLIVGIEWLLISDQGSSEGAGAARAGRLARASRSVRLLRLMRLAKLREMFFSLQGLFDSEWMTLTFTLCKGFSTILVLSHVLACLWFVVGSISESGWVYQAGLDGREVELQYLVALQWSMSQFTPGASTIHPKTIGERSYSVAVLALGVVVATCFISTITSTVTAVWAVQRQESTQALLLKKFLRQNNISRSLGSRVTRYIDCVMELRQQKVHPSRVQYLSMLSGPLHVELLSELREPQVFVHKMFRGYKDASICAFREICTTALQQNNFARNDILFHRKTDANYMYFLNSGTLVYRMIVNNGFGGQEQVKSKLGGGNWCCENALWIHWKHTGDMKAVSDVDVTFLDVACFCEVSSSDPEARYYVKVYCRQFMERIQQAASFDINAVTDLPLRVHVLGVDGGGELEQLSRPSLMPAAQALQLAEDMEAEIIPFPSLEQPERMGHQRSEGPCDQARAAKREKARFTFGETLELAQRYLSPLSPRSSTRSRTAP